jgi:transcriptional regulator with XRE-family HTH domain
MMTVDAPHTRRAFGARLKEERERRGTSLAAISDSTKVNPSLLEALERGDASRWPKGIYRRSFFRDYLHAIGLPADPYVGEFLELFPDGDEPSSLAQTAKPAPAAPVLSTGSTAGPGPLRLTFEDNAAGSWASRVGLRSEPAAGTLPRRALACIVDLLIVAAIAGVVSFAAAVSFWPAAAVAAAMYFSVGTLLLSRSPAMGAVTGYRRSADAAGSHGDTAPRAFWRDLRLPGAPLAGRGAALRSYLMRTSRFAPSREGPLQRDLAEVRRRRLEQAKRNADEIEAIG